ncbi:MAG TPA: MATE family efflux transporter [Rectinemataceae bacterium]|nr:MATE family efflux transporter [Rectinemataceae bacterium]
MNRPEAMGARPIGRLLLEFSIPSIAGMLVSSLYGLVDRIFIGRGIGIDGMAAVTAAFPVMMIGMAIGLLFAVGARSLASLSLGSGDHAKAEEYLSRATGTAFLAALAASLLCAVAVDPLLRLFGATPLILPGARSYLLWVLAGFPLQAASMTAGSSLQAQGKPRLAFLVLLSGTLLNAVLAPLFIFACHWGLGGAGAALATAQAFSLVLTLALVQSPGSSLKLRASLLLPEPVSAARLAAVGAPIFLVQLLGCAVMVVANNAMRPYGGELGLAVIGIVNTVAMVFGFPLFGLTNGAQPLWGFNYGAGKWSRISRLSVLVLAWTFALALLSELGMMLAPESFVRLFASDPALVALGSRALRVFMTAFVLFPLGIVPASYFQSTGRPLPAGILMLSRNLVMMTAMLVLSRLYGLDGVLWAGPVADTVTGVLGFVYLMKMRSEIGREELGAALVAPAASLAELRENRRLDLESA